MKKVSIYGISLLTAIAFATVMIFNACTNDPCKDVTCLNGGSCADGTCQCLNGFDGTDCSHQIRNDYLKTGASVSESCNTGAFNYNVDIVAGSAADEFKIKNLGNYNCSYGDYYVTATISGGTTFTINSQTVCATQFSGNGSISNGVVTVNYSATYDPGSGTQTDVCTATVN